MKMRNDDNGKVGTDVEDKVQGHWSGEGDKGRLGEGGRGIRLPAQTGRESGLPDRREDNALRGRVLLARLSQALQDTEVEQEVLAEEDNREHGEGQEEHKDAGKDGIPRAEDMGVPSFIDLFAGCGGLSWGFEKCGFENKGFVEFWKPAIATYVYNFKDAVLLGKDIRNISDEKISGMSCDIIMGGPPCQGFSMAGKRDVSDPRNSLFMEFIRFCRIIRPRLFIMENVPGQESMVNCEFCAKFVKNTILEEFRKIGYNNVKLYKVNFREMGVPQKRYRIIWAGSREDVDLDMIMDFNLKKRKVVSQAIGDLSCKENRGMQHIYPGLRKRVFFIEEGKNFGRFNATNKKVKWNSAAPTIMASGRYIHPRHMRYLSVREHARLQMFPDGFVFCGSMQEMYGQVGNAVPPRFSYLLARNILKRWGDFVGKEAEKEQNSLK